MRVALTGPTGKLGRRIAARLSAAGVPQLLVARDPKRLPDLPGALRRGPAVYLDRAAMRAAVDGADTLLLISANLSGRRLLEHSTAMQAALEAGVERILYVSLLGAAPDATYVNCRDHWQTEQFLAGLGVPYGILRAGFYSSMIPGLADRDGVLRGPAGDGRASLVAHDDLADVAVAIVQDELRCEIVPATGPSAVTLAEAAAQATRALGRPYSFRSESAAQSYAWRMAEPGADETSVRGWISWYEAIAAGEADLVTDAVPRLAGHPALTVEENLRRA
ncbi:MAG TPA: NAD(P)H-binding protein [Mycobacteriales bacterium]|jgi:NAD(P)H dehydrogenase (quinone)|nr:NAD(P)H-binding protein [Mycobacteriales bacterium]